MMNHLTSVRMDIHKKTRDKYWQACVHAAKNVQCILLVGVEIGLANMENNMRFLKRAKSETII